MEEYRKIDKDSFLSIVRKMMDEYTIYGPTENNGPVEAEDEYSFEEIDDVDDVSLEYTRTMIPPKKYFFPPKETILEMKDSEVKEPELEDDFVLLGVHPCDINSFLILDKMFARDPYNDPYYERRREKSLVIGVSCEPTEYCFCKSMDTDEVEEGFDLFLTKIPNEEGYIVTIGSEEGREIADDERFKPVDEDFAEEVIEESQDWEEELPVETDNLSEITYDSFDDETIWEELGERCLGCGNCTMVCPCCNCFDIKDEASLESPVVSRSRTWNACTLLEFAEVSGGNFRESIKSRYRNWFYDKYRIFPREIEEFGCVGCGRCIKYCPVDIDPREVIQEVRDKHAGK